VTLENASVFFNTGSASAKAIKLGGGVEITADPSNADAPARLTFLPGQGQAPPVANTWQTSSSLTPQAQTFTMQNPGQTSSALPQQRQLNPQAESSGPSPKSNLASSSVNDTLIAGTTNIAASSVKTAFLSTELQWISDTELASGEIPASLNDGDNPLLVPSISMVSDLGDCQLTKTDRPFHIETGPILQGRVNVSRPGYNAKSMTRGSVVFSPKTNTVVKTPMGDVVSQQNRSYSSWRSKMVWLFTTSQIHMQGQSQFATVRKS
jgi:hypothetical protein